MEKRQNRLTDWLEKLQQESWQLELLISGFLLSMLIGANGELKNYMSTNAEYLYGGFEGIVFFFLIWVLYSTSYILIINLIIHVVLRSLWIGAIGLRNISGEIAVENLQLSDKFRTYFDRKLPTFDEFIEKLENICCLIFAFTFIIIFSIFSFFIVIVFGAFFLVFLMRIGTAFAQIKLATKIIAFAFLLFYIIGGLLYLIDFISLGKIKKIKGLSKFYFPIYKFFSAVSLSKIYRPLYYNMIDNQLGRKVMLFIIPYLVILSFSSSMSYNAYERFPKKNQFTGIYDYNYECEIKDESYSSIYEILLSQKYYEKDDFLEIFIPYSTFPKKMKLKSCFSSFEKYETGFNFGGDFKVGFEAGSKIEKSDNVDTNFIYQKNKKINIIECVSSHFSIKISDTLQTKVTYDLYKHQKSKSDGILATIDIISLQRGKHFLDFYIKDSSDVIIRRISVPFWKK